MARSSAAASRPAAARQHAARSNGSGALSREQKLELYYYMRLTRSLEDYVLPQTSDIVLGLRKLAAY
jgi:hypothetical protein